MSEQEIIQIIQEEAIHYKWTLEEALTNLQEINFHVDKVVGNELFTENKVRQSLAWAKHALGK